MVEYTESIVLECCTVSLRIDGIIEIRFLWDTPYEITAEKLIAINDAIKSLYKGEKRAIISIAGLYGTLTQEAKELNTFHGSDTVALGLIIQSASQRLIANFYFKIKKAPYPVKFFKTEPEATEWLYEQVKQNKLAS